MSLGLSHVRAKSFMKHPTLTQFPNTPYSKGKVLEFFPLNSEDEKASPSLKEKLKRKFESKDFPAFLLPRLTIPCGLTQSDYISISDRNIS